METEALKIFEEFRSHVRPEMLEDIRMFLGVEEGVGECLVYGRRVKESSTLLLCHRPARKGRN